MAPAPPPSLLDLSQLRSIALDALAIHYKNDGLAEVRVPTLVSATGSCENVDSLLDVNMGRPNLPGSTDHEDAERIHATFLSQTGQLALEHVLALANGAWCHTGSYRNDSVDSRHLREFELIEEEFSWDLPIVGNASGLYNPDVLFDSLLSRVTQAIQCVLTAVPSDLLRRVAGSEEHIRVALDKDFARVTYDEALESINRWRLNEGVPQLAWGEDLRPRDEDTLLQDLAIASVQRPVFVTHFPKDIKFFNMKIDPSDSRRVLSADLLLPLAGETVGAAVRENDYETLRHRLETSQMLSTLIDRGGSSMDTFEPYLRMMKEGSTPPHAGYGIGFERLLQFIARSADIRVVSMPVRLGALLSGVDLFEV